MFFLFRLYKFSTFVSFCSGKTFSASFSFNSAVLSSIYQDHVKLFLVQQLTDRYFYNGNMVWYRLPKNRQTKTLKISIPHFSISGPHRVWLCDTPLYFPARPFHQSSMALIEKKRMERWEANECVEPSKVFPKTV